MSLRFRLAVVFAQSMIGHHGRNAVADAIFLHDAALADLVLMAEALGLRGKVPQGTRVGRCNTFG